jgi:hypothetical protein
MVINNEEWVSIHGEQIGSFHDYLHSEGSFSDVGRTDRLFFANLVEPIGSFHAVSWGIVHKISFGLSQGKCASRTPISCTFL